MGYEEEDDDENCDHNVHVIPKFKGEPKHVSTIDCWCEPEIEETEGVSIVTHRRIQ